MMAGNDGTAGPQSDIVDTTEAFLEHLRSHDGGADGENNPAVQPFHASAENAKVGFGGAADHGAVEHRMIGKNVVADARMDGDGDVAFKTLRENAVLLAKVNDLV